MSNGTNEINNMGFFLGGKATFTVYGPAGHYTFRINQAKSKDIFFCSLLSGPDNQNDYNYVGVYQSGRGRVILTRASKITEEATSLKALNWALGRLFDRKPFPAGYGVMHEGKCCVCAKPLTDPLSIDLGVGPICREKMAGGMAA